jgi:chromate transporter
MEETNVSQTSPQTPPSKGALLRKLFVTMLYISSFTFGGGFVIVTFMKRKFVDELHWMDETEMLDITALAQASPGGIAVNASILVGWRVAGLAGMVVAVVGTILPPMVILTIVSYFYAFFATNVYVALVLKGMQAGVAAVILDVVCSMGGNVLKSKKVLYIALMVAAFVANVLFSVNVIYIILAAAAVGILAEVVGHLRGGQNRDDSENNSKEEGAQ